MSKADIRDTGTPFILYGELYTTYGDVTNNIVRKTDKVAAPEQYSRIGDVIIPTSGETPDEIATATCVMVPNVILAGDLNIYRCKNIDGRIVSYIINHVINGTIARIAQGKSVVHIKAEELSKLFINYPSSAEQEKLISFLSLIDKRIEKQRQFVEALKSYKRGSLSKLFPKKGETSPENRFAGFTEPWEQRKFGEIVSRSSEMSDACAFPRVEYEDIVSGIGQLNKDIRKKESRKIGLLFREGDVLYGKLRPYLQNWLLPSFSGIAVGDFWVLQPQNANSGFVYRLIQTKQFDEVANQSTGTKMPRADWQLVSKTEFSIPQSINEQAQVGTFFHYLDLLITLHQRKLSEYENIKAGLLQQLFV